jgi:hypothetical protein
LRALVVANETGRNAIDVLDDEVGWQRLLQAKPEVEAMARMLIRLCWSQSATARYTSTLRASLRRLPSTHPGGMTR